MRRLICALAALTLFVLGGAGAPAAAELLYSINRGCIATDLGFRRSASLSQCCNTAAPVAPQTPARPASRAAMHTLLP